MGEGSLLFAAGAALLGGASHVVALVGGPRWIAALGAPPWVVQAAREGSWIVPVGGLCITAAMWLCAAYAFSGAGWMLRLPLLRTGLATIAFVCIARGLLVVPFVILQPEVMSRVGRFEIIASLVWLSIGLAYVTGLAVRWKDLSQA